METQTAFVRTDRRVELNAITEVRLYLTGIINPCNTESEDTVWLDHALHNLRCLKLRVLIVHLFDGFQYFLNGLQILCLARMFRR